MSHSRIFFLSSAIVSFLSFAGLQATYATEHPRRMHKHHSHSKQLIDKVLHYLDEAEEDLQEVHALAPDHRGFMLDGRTAGEELRLLERAAERQRAAAKLIDIELGLKHYSRAIHDIVIARKLQLKADHDFHHADKGDAETLEKMVIKHVHKALHHAHAARGVLESFEEIEEEEIEEEREREREKAIEIEH